MIKFARVQAATRQTDLRALRGGRAAWAGLSETYAETETADACGSASVDGWGMMVGECQHGEEQPGEPSG